MKCHIYKKEESSIRKLNSVVIDAFNTLCVQLILRESWDVLGVEL